MPSRPSGRYSFTEISEVRATSAMVRVKGDHHARTPSCFAVVDSLCRRSLKTRPVSLSEKWATRQQIWVGDQSAGMGGDPSSSLFRGLVGASCGGTARVGPSHGSAGVADGVAAAVLPGAGGISLRRGRATRSRPVGTVPVDAGDRAGRTSRLDRLAVVVP
jgi:hypothetical protein